MPPRGSIRARSLAEHRLERTSKDMKKQALIACLAGAALGLGMVWIPQVARADLAAEQHVQAAANRQCGYNNLFCEKGSRYCVICGTGHDIACIEQRSCDGLASP